MWLTPALYFADENQFLEATSVLLAWFERGEVTRRSANNFYSMVQAVNGHSRRLMSEKAAHEQELEDAKERFKNALAGILTGCKYLHFGLLTCVNTHWGKYSCCKEHGLNHQH